MPPPFKTISKGYYKIQLARSSKELQEVNALYAKFCMSETHSVLGSDGTTEHLFIEDQRKKMVVGAVSISKSRDLSLKRQLKLGKCTFEQGYDDAVVSYLLWSAITQYATCLKARCIFSNYPSRDCA